MKPHRIFSVTHTVVEALIAYGTLTMPELWAITRALDFQATRRCFSGEVSRMVKNGYLEPVNINNARYYRLSEAVRIRHKLINHIISNAEPLFEKQARADKQAREQSAARMRAAKKAA